MVDGHIGESTIPRTDLGPGQAPTSGAGEGGLAGAVLEERGDADAGVVGAEHVGEELLLKVEAAVQGDVEPAVGGSLGEAMGADGARLPLGGPRTAPTQKSGV